MEIIHAVLCTQHGYFDSLRAEIADSGVSVSIVCPGPVESDIHLHTVRAEGREALVSTFLFYESSNHVRFKTTHSLRVLRCPPFALFTLR